MLAGGHPSNGAVAQGSQSDGDSNNTTVSLLLYLYIPVNQLASFDISVSGLCYRYLLEGLILISVMRI